MAKKPKKVAVLTKSKEAHLIHLKRIVQYFYDLQKLRIQSSNRKNSITVQLDEKDKEFLDHTGKGLKHLEEEVLREVKRVLTPIPIYNTWLEGQRGVGPTMAGVLVAFIRIENCHTVSKLWAWCGLAVVNGEADRRRKGMKARFDPWLKSKILSVMGGNLIKAVSRADDGTYYTTSNVNNPNYDKTVKKPVAEAVERPDIDEDEDEADPMYFLWVTDPGDVTVPKLAALGAPAWKKTVQLRTICTQPPWRKFYDDYKFRKESMRVPVCMGCMGTGKYKLSAKEKERLEFLSSLPPARLELEDVAELEELKGSVEGDGKQCSNCNGTGKNAPWGRSKQHRHNAAQRYMVKMFLSFFWEEWRKLEGLPVRVPYAQEYLGIEHHA